MPDYVVVEQPSETILSIEPVDQPSFISIEEREQSFITSEVQVFTVEISNDSEVSVISDVEQGPVGPDHSNLLDLSLIFEGALI